MKCYRIHLIRHGTNKGAIEGKYIGHTDEPLSQQGRKELISLKNDFIYPDCNVVVSSPLKRCLETAKILYPNREPAIMRGFSEYNFGEFEGLTADELSKYPEFTQWLQGGEEAATPSGESNGAFKMRVLKDFLGLVEGLFKTGDNSCVVITHGGVIMTILSAFGVPELPMHEWLTPCGCGYTVQITPYIWSKVNKFEVTAEIPLSTHENKGEEKDE